MSYSLGEVEATAKKATRAVGYSWGLAEEAAKSARYLCTQNIDGCALLARYLHRVDNGTINPLPPIIEATTWKAKDGCLCPLYTGVALSDRAAAVDSTGIIIEPVAEPALLFYFAKAAIGQLHRRQHHSSPKAELHINLRWPEGQCTTDGLQLATTGSIDDYTGNVWVTLIDAVELPQEIQCRATPDTCAWLALTALANRTYAPATEESRQRGAGAGISDSD